MSYDKNKRFNVTRGWVDVNDKDEMQFWCSKFGVSEVDLRRTVRRTGALEEDVEREFKP